MISPRGVLFRRNPSGGSGSRLPAPRGGPGRDEDGRLAVASASRGGGPARSCGPSGALDRANAKAKIEALEDIRAEGLGGELCRCARGRSWTVDGGNLAVSFGREKLEIAGDLSSDSGFGRADGAFRRAKVFRRGAGGGDAVADRKTGPWPPTGEPVGRGLSWLAVLDRR